MKLESEASNQINQNLIPAEEPQKPNSKKRERKEGKVPKRHKSRSNLSNLREKKEWKKWRSLYLNEPDSRGGGGDAPRHSSREISRLRAEPGADEFEEGRFSCHFYSRRTIRKKP